jgi:hypothetical protein
MYCKQTIAAFLSAQLELSTNSIESPLRLELTILSFTNSALLIMINELGGKWQSKNQLSGNI